MSFQMRGGNQLIDAVKVLLKGGIKQGAIVADLGCGATGHFVFPAAHLVGPKGKIYAVDLLKTVLQAIESRRRMEGVDNVETIWADLEKSGGVKIAAGSVDIVLLLNTLFQIKDKEAVLSETARLAKPGGTLVIVDWKSTASPFGPSGDRRLSPSFAKQLAQSVGFEFVEDFEAGPYHFGLVFRKR